MKARPPARIAGRPDSAAMVLNDVLNDGEPKSRAALLARAGFINTIEPLEHPFEGFRRYPRTVILDEYLDLAAVPGASANDHSAFGAAILDGVINQVAQHLFQPVSVSTDGQVGSLVDKLDAFGGRPIFEIFKDFGDDGVKRHGLKVEFDAAGLQFGNGKQILDEQLKALRIAVNGLQEFSGHPGVVLGAIKQRFDIAFDEGKGGAEFMTDIAHEFLAGTFELLQPRQIVEVTLAIASRTLPSAAQSELSQADSGPRATVSGLWIWRRISEYDGTPLKNYFMLDQLGTTLTGKFEYPWGGTATLIDGHVEGTHIRFSTDMEDPKPEYFGTVDGDRMELTLNEKGKSVLVTLVKLPPGTPMYAPAPAPPPIRPLPSNGLVRTPPMGWNAWNHFHDFIDDRTVREIADAIVSSGMRDAGYIYVNIDDEWAGQRDSEGNIHPNRNFPDMKALADYIHSKGLKLGIYSSPGPETCEGHVGSLGHEDQDAQTYAHWGVDYLKYDWCSASFVYKDSDMQAVYQKMGAALQETQRPIVYSLCQYGRDNVPQWGSNAGGNLWRTTSDISDNWKSMFSLWEQQAPIAQWNRPGGWNDPDMLEVGNGGMSPEEYRAHFSLWSLLSTPLIAGNDPRSMSTDTVAILTNREVVAIDQDALAAPPRRLPYKGKTQIWMKPLANGDAAVLFLNPTDRRTQVDFNWSEIGIDGNAAARDLWERRDLGSLQRFQTEIPAHGVRMLRVAGVGAVPTSKE